MKKALLFILLLLLGVLLSTFVSSPVKNIHGLSTPNQLTSNTATDRYLSISGDGSKIAFSSNVDGDSEIFVINVGEEDTTPPTGAVVINGDAAYTSSTSVTLSLSYSDAGSGVLQVRYSNDGVWDTELWESPATSKSWALTSGDGAKTVYCQVKDNSWNTAVFSDAITLDTIAPTGSIVINGGASTTNSQSVTLTLTSSDSDSGVFQVRYSNDGVWDTEQWEFPSSSKVWTLTFGDGEKPVYYQIVDIAGLISKTYSDTIVLTSTVSGSDSESDSSPDNGPSPSPSPSPQPTSSPSITSTPTPSLQPTPSQTPLSEEQPFLLYAVVAGVAFAAIGTVVFLLRKRR